MSQLIQSSSNTREWLNTIVSEVTKRIPTCSPKNAKYWTTFKSRETNRNFVALNPLAHEIRVFTKLELAADRALQSTPATQEYAKLYPSIFLVKSEKMISKAVELIVKSYERDQILAKSKR